MTDGSTLSTDGYWTDQKVVDACFYTGQWIAAGRCQDAVNPSTGAVIGSVGLADPDDIRRAAAAAKEAQVTWAAAPYEARAALLRKAAAIAESNRNHLADWLVRESGSTALKAGAEVGSVIRLLHDAAAMPLQSTGHVLPSVTGQLSLARRRPIGVIGIISPFNFPLHLAMRAVAPALAVGNAVVLKPDPRTAISGGYNIARIFEQAGLPAGLLHVLPGDGAAGAALCEDPAVGMIQFTGSTGAGRKVGEAAGRNLKKVSLELGGKNALIILDDADLDLAVNNAVWSAYFHQGQICMAAGRIIVHRAIVEEFQRKLAERVGQLSVGDPSAGQVALGPLINRVQVDHALGIVEKTVAQGGELMAGGTADGLFFQPTVLSGVAKGMSAYEEEIFGPVAVVIAVDDDEEAARVANDTVYGLSAGIISQSVGRAMALGERLHAGMVHVNDGTVKNDGVNPFGGVGASGNGTSIGGPANWEEFTHWQWITVKDRPPAYPL